MGLINGLQVGFKQVYAGQPDQDIAALLHGIPRGQLLKVVSGLLAEQVKSINDVKELIDFWFRDDNLGFASDAYTRLKPIEDEFKNLSLAGAPAALKLYSYALNHLAEEKLLSDVQIEVNLFKAFLVQNDLLNLTDDKVTETTENLEFTLRWYGLHFAQSVRFSDVVNFDLYELFISEFIRSVLLFEFLESGPETQALLKEFYKIYEVESWDQYLQQLSGVSLSILNKTNKGFLELIIPQGENFEREVKFLDKLSSIEYDELTDNDFKALREKPLQKIGEGSYRIIYGLFCIERVFKGLYFNLKAVNQSLPNSAKVKDLRNLYTYKFSEQFALYYVLNKALPKKYLRITGEEISSAGYQGGPDFYIRNNNKAFIFESKDSLINAAIKETGNFTALLEDLKSKFYIDKTSPKAVMQLLNCIIDMYKERFLTIDPSYKKEFIRIYPIVVIHDRQLDVPGFNNILNYWFIPELQKVSNIVDISKVKPITVVDTTTVILIHELLNSRQIMLEDAIDEYHEFVKFKKQYKSYDELMQHGHDTTLPFSFFIKQIVRTRKLKRYPEKMLKEKAFVGLGE
ncbi:MAG: hypothetical protein RH948_04125 [Cyclobacteriaceae bacterium]